MSVKKPACECCGRVRKKDQTVHRCSRCTKYVCMNPHCRIPHDAQVCGDQFANRKARALAEAQGS